MLSKASNNLGATLVLMKDGREKFDTIRDCEPAIERLKRGVVQMQNNKSGKAKKARRNPFEDGEGKEKNVVLSEQDVYAAADSMEIIRDAYEYFIERKNWRSTAGALASLERVHQMGVSSMCILASFHLIDSGQAVRIKRVVKQEGEAQITPATETAAQVRETDCLPTDLCVFLEQRLTNFLYTQRLATVCLLLYKIAICSEALENSRNTSRLKLALFVSCVGFLNPWVVMVINLFLRPRLSLLV